MLTFSFMDFLLFRNTVNTSTENANKKVKSYVTIYRIAFCYVTTAHCFVKLSIISSFSFGLGNYCFN